MLRSVFGVNFLLCSFFFFCSIQTEVAAYSQIIPINDNWLIIKEFLKNPSYNNNKTVFLINLYDNLLQPNQFIGSKEWVEERKKYLINHTSYKDQQQLFKEIEALENYLSYKLTNPLLPQLITKITENSSCLIFGLAERSASSIPITISRIKEFNINFSKKLKSYSNVILQHIKNPSSFIFFTEGIIFSNFNSLSSICSILFQQHYYINTLIYSDSCINNLKTIQNFCEENGINFFGLLNNSQINKYLEQKYAASILIQGITNLLSDKAAALSLQILLQNTLTK